MDLSPGRLGLFIFGSLFIIISMALGLLIAILLDQKIRTEGALRTIYLYPMALSMIVTGTAWKWILNPGLGLESVVQGFGFENFKFEDCVRWIKKSSRQRRLMAYQQHAFIP